MQPYTFVQEETTLVVLWMTFLPVFAPLLKQSQLHLFEFACVLGIYAGCLGGEVCWVFFTVRGRGCMQLSVELVQGGKGISPPLPT